MSSDKSRPRAQWPKPTIDAPKYYELAQWTVDGVARATDGCTVETDGICEHGHPSWLLLLGYV